MPKKNLKKPYFLIAIFLIVSPAMVLSFSTLYFYQQMNLYLSFNDNLSYNNFIGEFKEPDYALLEKRSWQIEDRIQRYHTPNGSVLPATFERKDLTEVDHWSGLDDSDIWTGCYIAGEAFRWAVADRNGDIENRTRAASAILRAINHFDDLLQVTGIKGALARYACPGTDQNYELGLWKDTSTLVEGGPYDGWRFNTYISRDQLNGVSFGYGIIYSLVKNDTITGLIEKHVEWIVDYFERVQWNAIMENGWNSFRLAPMEPMLLRTYSGSSHLIAWVNLGRLVNFEKYDPIYRKWVIDKNLAFMTDENVRSNVLYAYYTINVVTLAMYNMINLESDPTLRNIYVDSYVRSVYDVVRYHRNAFQNFIYMNVTGLGRSDPEAVMIIKDSLDALQRYAEAHYPSCREEVYNSWWSDYEDIVDPISIQVTEVMSSPLMQMNPLASHTSFEVHAKYALPVDRRAAGSFIWQNSPFELDSRSDHPKHCYGGVDFTLAYWMGRYNYYIPDGRGVYN